MRAVLLRSICSVPVHGRVVVRIEGARHDLHRRAVLGTDRPVTLLRVRTETARRDHDLAGRLHRVKYSCE
jgi:hypothetical protein